jgi:diguanylate cyclase (GGDEF)-like protein
MVLVVITDNDDERFSEETDSDRRRGVLVDNALSVELVSAFSGDRPLTEAEKNYFAELEKTRGLRFYSDLFYAITHEYFAPEIAEPLWTEVLRHKYELSKAVGRDVKIVVAVLDYFSNITDNMDMATLVSETHIGEIIGLSLRDGLTGLFNHSYFYQQIELEFNRYLRYGTQFTLVLIDIDDFKEVNDIYGHREGDRILAEMGKTFLHLARDSDICARYGGEEFAVILPLTDIDEAGEIADRMRIELAKHKLSDGRTVSVSIGVASCGEKTLIFQNLVEKADAALYRAKRNGKNRVVLDADAQES